MSDHKEPVREPFEDIMAWRVIKITDLEHAHEKVREIVAATQDIQLPSCVVYDNEDARVMWEDENMQKVLEITIFYTDGGPLGTADIRVKRLDPLSYTALSVMISYAAYYIAITSVDMLRALLVACLAHDVREMDRLVKEYERQRL